MTNPALSPDGVNFRWRRGRLLGSSLVFGRGGGVRRLLIRAFVPKQIKAIPQVSQQSGGRVEAALYPRKPDFGKLVRVLLGPLKIARALLQIRVRPSLLQVARLAKQVHVG